MPRALESLLIALFALVFQAPFLAAMFWAVYGADLNYTQWQLAVLLAVAGAVSAFVAAWFMLGRVGLRRYAEGARLGLWSALGFYLMWILLFGVVPAVVGLEQGRLGDSVLYFAEIVWIVLLASRGLPLIVGPLGGLAYVGIKRLVARPGS